MKPEQYKPNNFERNKIQALADLKYPLEVRNNLSKEEVEEIINKNISYESFLKIKELKSKNENPITNPISEEDKEKYKIAYEKFQEYKGVVDLIDDGVKNERFLRIIKLAGSGSLDEIDQFLNENKEQLDEEEFDFLQATKKYSPRFRD